MLTKRCKYLIISVLYFFREVFTMLGKKIIAVILALSFIFALAACSGGTDIPDETTTAAEETTVAETTAKGERVTYTNRIFNDFTKTDPNATVKDTVDESKAGDSIETFCKNIEESEIHTLPPEIADTAEIDDEYIIKYFLAYYSGISSDETNYKTVDGKKYAVVPQNTLSTLLYYTFRVKTLPRPTKAESSSCYYENGCFYIEAGSYGSEVYRYGGLEETADGYVATLTDGNKTCGILLAEDDEGCYVKSITIK